MDIGRRCNKGSSSDKCPIAEEGGSPSVRGAWLTGIAAQSMVCRMTCGKVWEEGSSASVCGAWLSGIAAQGMVCRMTCGTVCAVVCGM